MASNLDPIDSFLAATDYSATSPRTMKNSAGNIGFAPMNLIKSSEDFASSDWTKTNTVTVTSDAAMALDGTLTADLIVDGTTSSYIQCANISTLTGNIYQWGWLVKYYNEQWLRFNVNDDTVWVDVQNGVIGTDGTEGTTITALSDGWYLLTCPDTAPDTSAYMAISTAASDGSSTRVVNGGYYIWGVHMYENGLAGMFDVPEDQRALAALNKYLPNSTGSPKFLPRRDNHEYIDGAWVQGLKAESEARTNLVTNGLDLSAWAAQNNSTVTQDQTGPDGTTSAWTLGDDSSTGTGTVYKIDSVTVSTSTTYTYSVYLKADQLSWARIALVGFTTPGNVSGFFDLSSGVVGSAGSGLTLDIEDVGGGWYRCMATFTTDASDTSGQIGVGIANSDGVPTVDLDGTSSVIVYGAQLEAGSTPSSLIPTYGATRTRTAETFTQKSDKIIWPNTTYVDGTELVTNGAFDTDTDWTKGTGWTIGGGTATHSAGSASNLSQASISTTANAVYEITYTVDYTSGPGSFQLTFGSSGIARSESGTYTETFVTSGASTTLYVYAGTSVVGSIDNISVKEINPRALCVVMHGYMTYADEGSNLALSFMNWELDANNYLKWQARLEGAETGTVRAWIGSSGVGDIVENVDAYSPGVNVPFKIAGRFLDNALQGAADGTATTENTTPVGLPDLSATQTEWFYDFMGHITFVGVGQEAKATKLDSTEGPVTLTTATSGGFLS